MLVQPKKSIGLLALLDPDLPGAILLANGQWGINLAAALLNFPNQGLKVFILVWANKSLGDKVELLLNNNVVDQHTVTQNTELTQRTTLFVAPGRLQTGPWQLAYRVTRFGQQPELYTPPLELLVKLELPGGQDIDPGYGHSELHMEFDPPEVVQDGVDKDTAKDGVDILVVAKPGSGSSLPYPNIAVGDVITVSWGGQLVQSDPVTQEQIDDPVKHPIVIHIDNTIIDAAGDSGPEGVAVTFMVQDIVLNQSEDWCKETRIAVDTGNSRLDAPILADANGNELDLDTLGNEDLTLQVWAASNEFQRNDVVIMNLTGTTAEGKAIKVEVRQSIDKTPPTVVEVSMENAGARALAKTQARFAFKLERGGLVIQHSKGRFINIVGESERLKAPVVVSAVGGALDPNLPSVIIRIPYDPQITPDNAIVIVWVVTLPDGTVYEPDLDWIFPTQEEADDPKGFIVLVSGIHLKPGEGGTLDVSYNLLSEGENGEVISRPSLPAAQLNIGEPQLELVVPIVAGVKGDMLEPKDLPNGISEVTCPNPVNNPTKSKDEVFWQLRDAQGKLLFEDNKLLNSLSAGKDVKFSLSASFVQQYFEARRGEELSVRYHIVRFESGKTSYSNPLEFVVGQVVPLIEPTLTKVMDANGKEIPEGAPTISTTLKAEGKASNGKQVEFFDGRGASAVSKGTATADATTGEWKLSITVGLGVHRLYAKSLYHSDPVFSNVRNLTVVPNIVPELHSVEDPDQKEIENNGSTTHTIVTLRGIATAGTDIYLVNYGAPIPGTDILVNRQGEWHFQLGLKAGTTYNLRAKRKDGAVSNARNLTVVDLVEPTITSVKGGSANGPEILPGGYTTKTTLVFSGKASANQKIELRDNEVVKDAITVDATGDYSRILTDQAEGVHSYKVRATYGPLPESSAWILTVEKALVVDTTLMLLDGVMVRSSRCPNWNGVDAPGNTAVRPPSGGTPPYRYQSSHPSIAPVDANGKVTGMANGAAIITISDSLNAQVIYSVLVSNVYDLTIYHSASRPAYPWTYATYTSVQSRAGYVGLIPSLRAVMQRCYRHPWFVWNGYYPNAWTGGAAGEAYQTTSGAFYTANVNSDLDYGFGFYLRVVGMSSMGAAQDNKDDSMVIVTAPE